MSGNILYQSAVEDLRRIQFINKMQNVAQAGTECTLSPKELQQRQARAHTLQKIDLQIDKILAMGRQEYAQQQEFWQNMVSIEQHYKLENQQLKKALNTLSEKYHSLEAMYLSLKEQLSSSYFALQQAHDAQQALTQEVGRLRSMVKNQEQLIDEYRKNLEEEIILEQEFMKAEFEEQKVQLQKDFNRALIQIEKQYEEKLRKARKESQLREYQTECQQLRRYLGGGQKGRASRGKILESEYSTTDQENRHNQPIFMS